MQPNFLKINQNELHESVSSKLEERLYQDMSGGNTPATNGTGKRRGRPSATTSPSDVPDKQILDLVRQRGPQRAVEIQEATGLTISAVYKKLAKLRDEDKALKEVKEGTVVRYALTRGATSARKSARKTNGATPRKKRRGKKTRAAKKAAAA